ncbi:MAG: hypothetical protein ABJ056_03805 [Halioglobus sp.]
MAGTSSQKWVINLAMGRFGGLPADYTQVKPRALLSDLTLEPLSPESPETNPSTAYQRIPRSARKQPDYYK